MDAKGVVELAGSRRRTAALGEPGQRVSGPAGTSGNAVGPGRPQLGPESVSVDTESCRGAGDDLSSSDLNGWVGQRPEQVEHHRAHTSSSRSLPQSCSALRGGGGGGDAPARLTTRSAPRSACFNGAVLDRQQFLDALPRKRIAAGALIRTAPAGFASSNRPKSPCGTFPAEPSRLRSHRRQGANVSCSRS